MSETRNSARRAFLRRAAGAAVILPLAGLGARPARAQDDPIAENGHAQNYVQVAADSDHSRYREGSQCSNCVFWRGGDADHGPCQHPQFRGVQVAAGGWCAAYAKGS